MKGNRSMQDMTEGRPISLILKFFFPLLFGMLFQQFYNMVDTIIVGTVIKFPIDIFSRNTAFTKFTTLPVDILFGLIGATTSVAINLIHMDPFYMFKITVVKLNRYLT